MLNQIVYCSGPMFSLGEQSEQQDIEQSLSRRGFHTYLPQRDGIAVARLFYLLRLKEINTDLAQMALAVVRRCIFSLDMYQLIERCTCAVFNLDGRVPDEGSIVETSAAYTIGKPIVIFKSTPIRFIAGQDNPMVEGLSYTWHHCSKIDEVPDRLNDIINKVGNNGYQFYPPPQLSRVIDLGRNIANPDSDLRRIVREIGDAHDDGAKALARTQRLVDWASASHLFQSGYGSLVSWVDPHGVNVELNLAAFN
jgi:nucleoside 2-deoxyribosyltransferase